jgi:multiple sugar transport system permease protein/putative aldouronate transport system permease protein
VHVTRTSGTAFQNVYGFNSLARFLKSVRTGWRLYVLILLPLAYLIIFKYVPMYGAQIAFKNYVVTKGIAGSEWVGLKHFERFFHSYDFYRVMRNTILLSVYNLAVGFPIPIILALSLNYVNLRWFKKTVQMVTYAPHFISTVVMVGIILQFLTPRTGFVNIVRDLLGLEQVNYMGEASYFIHILVWSDVWQNMGFSCIIYLASLASIDPSLHEAAIVDGATKLQRMRHVDLPGIMPIAVILLILNMGNILDTGFEKILLMQNPLNLRTSEVIDTYVYKVGLASEIVQYSYASAIGFFKAIVGLVLMIAVNRLARRVGQTGLW